MAKEDRVLGYTFDPPRWWVARAKALTEPRGVKAHLVRAWNEKYKDILMDEPKIKRAVEGERTQIEVAIRLSSMLGIPPPILVPGDEDEARFIVGEMAARRGIDPKIREIRAGVAEEETARQSGAVVSENGRPKRTKRGRVGVSRP